MACTAAEAARTNASVTWPLRRLYRKGANFLVGAVEIDVQLGPAPANNSQLAHGFPLRRRPIPAVGLECCQDWANVVRRHSKNRAALDVELYRHAHYLSL